MKIDLNEIWEFMELVPQPAKTDQGAIWLYKLVVGEIIIDSLTSEDIHNFKMEKHYDTELLPSIFTFREILWQPNVYPQPAFCIPQLNILKTFCEEYVQDQSNNTQNSSPYLTLLKGLALYCKAALAKITEDKGSAEISIPSILGQLRKEAFPIIKFFIFHPLNRADYKKDALNRLNYAVKVMLTQYKNKYHDLQDPYWHITTGEILALTTDPNDNDENINPIIFDN